MLNIEQAVGRLTQINRQQTTAQHQWSNMLLLREYLRRAAQRAALLNTQSQWPFFDIAFYIDPNKRAGSRWIEQVQAQAVEPFEQRVYEWYLHWAAVQTSIQLTEISLLPPYDPLIRIYERGADEIDLEGDFIGLSKLSIRVPAFEECLDEGIIVDPESSLLDELDDPEIWLARRKPGRWSVV